MSKDKRKAPARSKSSVSCGGVTTALDNYLAKKQIYVRSASTISIERGMLLDDDTVDEDDFNRYTENLRILKGITKRELKALFYALSKITHYDNFKTMSIEDLNKYFPKSISKFEIENIPQLEIMIGDVATILRTFEDDLYQNDAIFSEMTMSGNTTLSRLELVKKFKDNVPLHLRNEVKSEVLHAIIEEIGNVSQDDNSPYYGASIEQILSEVGIDTFVARAYRSMKRAYIDNLLSVSDQVYQYSELQKRLYHRMFHIGIKKGDDLQIWSYVVSQCKTDLMKSLRIKIDDSSIENLSKEDFYEESEEEKTGVAEETGPEHWMIKADMVNSYLSLSADIKRLLYLLPQTTLGPFGRPSFSDIMSIHKRLLYIRSTDASRGSADFLIAIGNYKSREDSIDGKEWAKKLVEVFKTNSYLATRFFRAYRKAILNYSSYKIRRDGTWVRTSTTKNSSNSLFYKYKQDYLTILNPGYCIFNQQGTVNADLVRDLFIDLIGQENLDAIEDQFYMVTDDEGNIYNYSERNWGSKTVSINPDSNSGRRGYLDRMGPLGKFSFVEEYLKSQNLYGEINKNGLTQEEYNTLVAQRRDRQTDLLRKLFMALNIRYTEFDVDVTSDKKFFECYKAGLTLLYNLYLNSQTNSVFRIETFLSKNTSYTYLSNVKKAFKVLLSSTTEEIIKSYTSDDSFRYQKGTYFANTTPNFLMDVLEKIKMCALNKYTGDELSYELTKIFDSSEDELTEVSSLQIDRAVNNFSNPLLARLYEIADTAGERELNEKEIQELLEVAETIRILGTDDTEFRKLSEGKDVLIHFLEYQNKLDETGGKYCNIPTFVTGDSNSTRTFTVPFCDKNTAMQKLRDIAFMELVRMAESDFMLEAGIDNKSIDMHSREFCYLPFLNRLLTKEQIDELVKEIKENYGAARENIDNLKAIKEKFLTAACLNGRSVRENIKIQQDIQFSNFLKKLESEDIITAQKKPGGEKTYRFIRNTIKYSADQIVDMDDLFDFYLNYKVGMYSQLQMLTTDPSFYENSNDAQKRFKEIIAAGDPLDMQACYKGKDDSERKSVFGDEEDPKQRGLYVDDIRVGLDEDNISEEDKKFKEALERLGPDIYNPYTKSHGKGSTMTDGQVWRSFTSYRKLMVAKGTWTDECEAIWNIIQGARSQNRDLTIEELKKIEGYNVCFQPIKSYWYGFEKVSYQVERGGKTITLTKNVPVQIKCSEYPVIPELLPKGNRLRTMGKFMEDNDFDFIASHTTIKVGLHHTVTFDDIQNFNDEAFAAEEKAKLKAKFDQSVHSLSWSYWREQSNQPEHIDVARARGTQFQKHALEGLAEILSTRAYACLKRIAKNGKINLGFGQSADIETSDKPGLEIMKIFNVLLGAGYLESVKNLCKKYASPKNRSKALVKKALLDTRRKSDGIESYELDASDGDFIMSPAEGQDAQDNMAGVISDFKKGVIKQRMKGGSAIQVSPYGFDDILNVRVEDVGGEKNVNVVYAECAKAFDFSVTIDGQQVKLDYFDYVDPSTGMPLGTDGKTPVEPAEAEPGVKGHEYYGWNTLLGQRVPGAFDLIAYRIPTEKTYSVINLKVKRFLLKTGGAVIIVPTHFTTVAGFDFDIDKLYFVRREYEFVKDESKTSLESEVNKKIWDVIYTDWGKDVAAEIDAILERREDEFKTRYANLVAERDKLAPEQEGSKGIPTFIKCPFELGYDQKSNKYIYKKQIFDENGKPVLGENNEPVYDIHVATEDEIALSKEIQQFNTELDRYNKESEEFFKTQRYSKYQLWEEAVRNLKAKDPNYNDLPDTAQDAFIKEIKKPKYRHHFLKRVSDYDDSQPLNKYTQVQRNNLFFDLYQARLEDPDTMKDRFNPGGYRSLQKKKKLMLTLRYAPIEELSKVKNMSELQKLCDRLDSEGKLELNYDYLDPFTVAHYHVYNSLYDDLIGVAANQSLNQTLVALCKTFRLKMPFTFGSMPFSTGKLGDRSTGTDLSKRYIRGIDTETQTTEFLTGAVDAVKDAIIEFFGVDVNNFNMAVFTSRIGANVEDIGFLFNQPICILAANRMRRGLTSSFSDGLMRELFSLMRGMSEADQNIVKNYLQDEERKYMAGIRKPNDINSISNVRSLQSTLNMDTLLNNIISFVQFSKNGNNYLDALVNVDSMDRSDPKFINFVKKQVLVIIAMKRLERIATQMSDQVNIAKTTSLNTVKSEYGFWLALKDRCKTVISKLVGKDSEFEIELTEDGSVTQIINPDLTINPVLGTKGFKDIWQILVNSPYGIEQAAYTSMFTFARYVIDVLFPYNSETFQVAREVLNTVIGKTHCSGEIYNKLNKNLTAFLMGKFLSKFDPDGTTVVLDEKGQRIYARDASGNNIEGGITNKYFYTYIFPEYLDSILKANALAIAKKSTGNAAYANIVDYSKFAIFKLFRSASTFMYGGKGVKKRMQFRFTGNMETTSKDDLAFELEQMVRSHDPILRSLAMHMLMYSFFYSGITFSRGSIFGYTPLYIKQHYFNGDSETDNYRNFFNTMSNLSMTGLTVYKGVIQRNDRLGSPTKQAFLKHFIMSFIADNYMSFYQSRKYVRQDLYGPLAFINNSTYDNPEDFFNNSDEFGLSIEVLESVKELRDLAIHTERGPDGKLEEVVFPPVLIINGNAFICDSDITDNENPVFNVARKGQGVKYYRIQSNRFGLNFNSPSIETVENRVYGNISLKFDAQTAGGQLTYTEDPNDENDDYNPVTESQIANETILNSPDELKDIIVSYAIDPNVADESSLNYMSLIQSELKTASNKLYDAFVNAELDGVVSEDLHMNFSESSKAVLFGSDESSGAIGAVFEIIRQLEMFNAYITERLSTPGKMLEPEIIDEHFDSIFVAAKAIIPILVEHNTSIRQRTLYAPGYLTDAIYNYTGLIEDLCYFLSDIAMMHNDYHKNQLKNVINRYSMLVSEGIRNTELKRIRGNDIGVEIKSIKDAFDTLRENPQNISVINAAQNILLDLRSCRNSSELLDKLGDLNRIVSYLGDSETKESILTNIETMKRITVEPITLQEIAENPENKQNICVKK